MFCLIFFPRDWAKERSRKFIEVTRIGFWQLKARCRWSTKHWKEKMSDGWRFANHFAFLFLSFIYNITFIWFLLQSLRPAERFLHCRCSVHRDLHSVPGQVRTRYYLTSARCTNHSKLSRTLFTIEMGGLIWYYRVLLLRQPPLLWLNPKTLVKTQYWATMQRGFVTHSCPPRKLLLYPS